MQVFFLLVLIDLYVLLDFFQLLFFYLPGLSKNNVCFRFLSNRASLKITSKIFKFTGGTKSMALNKIESKPIQKGNSLNPTSSLQ